MIAGNRRFAAAIKAGLTAIPANIVQMSDVEAAEAQIIENLQREDVHPLDEGFAYRKLREQGNYEYTVIAAKVGKSETYVRQRLFLTNLQTEPAEAYRTGQINDGHAVQIAQLNGTDQQAALQAIVKAWKPMTVAELKKWIEENITVNLAFQPWLNSEELMEVVGKCKECKPNEVWLFGAVEDGACTTRECWQRKMQKYVDHQAKTAKLTKISSVWQVSGKNVLSKSEYVVLDVAKGKCDSAHRGIIAEGENLGREVEICSDKNCKTHRSGGYQRTPEEEKAAKERAKAEKQAAKEKRDAFEALLTETVLKVRWPLDEKQLDALLALAISKGGSVVHPKVCKRLGW